MLLIGLLSFCFLILFIYLNFCVMFKRLMSYLVGDSDDPKTRRKMRHLGFGRAMDVISEAMSNLSVQRDLLEPENLSYLRAFIMRGCEFSEKIAAEFFAKGERLAVIRYLEHGRALSEASIMAILNRKDEGIMQVMFNEKLWCPMPYAVVSSFPSNLHQDRFVSEADA